MDKWFKYILPDKDPYHNRGRDQMRKKGGPNFKCLWKIPTTTTLELLITCLTKQQLYSFWSPGSPNNNFTASDHLVHQTTTLQLLITWLTKQQLYIFWSPGSPNNNFTASDHLPHQTTTLQLLITWLTKQLYSFWPPGSPNNNFTASDHQVHQTTTHRQDIGNYNVTNSIRQMNGK
jgi:hypothetical protein